MCKQVEKEPGPNKTFDYNQTINMQIRYTLLLLFCFSITILQSQQPDTFGKVTQEGIAMVTYPKDSLANAVVLYKWGDNYFEVISIL
ncbi:MAG: hypothetical protein CR994_00505 [Maribacter sp.]|nr:MAG: hypothetical protein CR994_00505 [Maribacter sp.]